MTHSVVSIAKPTEPWFSEEQPVPVPVPVPVAFAVAVAVAVAVPVPVPVPRPVPVPAQWIIRGLFKRIECKKVKDEIKEGYQIIFFLNCRWVGFKSPKLVQ